MTQICNSNFYTGFDPPSPLYTMCKKTSDLVDDGFPKKGIGATCGLEGLLVVGRGALYLLFCSGRQTRKIKFFLDCPWGRFRGQNGQSSFLSLNFLGIWVRVGEVKKRCWQYHVHVSSLPAGPVSSRINGINFRNGHGQTMFHLVPGHAKCNWNYACMT